jgi:hypothetical protein
MGITRQSSSGNEKWQLDAVSLAEHNSELNAEREFIRINLEEVTHHCPPVVEVYDGNDIGHDDALRRRSVDRGSAVKGSIARTLAPRPSVGPTVRTYGLRYEESKAAT